MALRLFDSGLARSGPESELREPTRSEVAIRRRRCCASVEGGVGAMAAESEIWRVGVSGRGGPVSSGEEVDAGGRSGICEGKTGVESVLLRLRSAGRVCREDGWVSSCSHGFLVRGDGTSVGVAGP